jgi:hypothetical protein
MTMQLIETKTLLSAAASIEFTSIPQDSTDLLVLFSLRATTGTGYIPFGYRFNGNTSGYTARSLYGTGSSVGSELNTLIAGADGLGNTGRFGGYGINWNSSTSNTFTSGNFYIPNYAGSNQKSASVDYVNENNATLSYQELVATLWANTSAITSLTIAAQSGSNLAIGSTISLYKITKGSDGITTVS